MEGKFKCEPLLEIHPSCYEDGIPIFKPSYDEFKDFYLFQKSINQYGMKSGIVKVIPPESWIDGLPSYADAKIEDVKIKNPITQHINGSNGVYSQQNIEKQRTYTMEQWKAISEKSNYQPPAPRGQNRKTAKKSSKTFTYNIDTREFTKNRCEQLEKAYWKTLTYAEPMYGADMLGSLFDDTVENWNVSKLPNVLDLMEEKLPGVNDAYLYAGLWKSTFAWHLEDQDLYSINYLHFGAPKQWYSIPQDESGRFFQLMKETFSQEYKNCPEFLRHKTFLVSPSFLEKHDIKFNKVTHREKEFIITYPYGYHAGFNYGYNLAESVNFALDDWFPFGEITKKCECISDSVAINVKQMFCKFKGIPYETTESPEPVEVSDLETPEIMVDPTKQSPRKTSLKDTKATRHTKVVRRECALCPSNLPKKLTNLKLFQLIKLDTHKSETVHRICALSLRCLDIETQIVSTPRTSEQTSSLISSAKNSPSGERDESFSESSKRLAKQTDVQEIVRGFSSIKPAQRKLRCLVCHTSNGVCFQCDFDKCSRSYHATCALSAGMLLESPGADVSHTKISNHLCKYHRWSDDKSDYSSISKNSLIQINLNGDYFAGLVTINNVSECTVNILAYPKLRDYMEVSYDNLVSPGDIFFKSRLKKRLLNVDGKTTKRVTVIPRSNSMVKVLDDLRFSGIKDSTRLQTSFEDFFGQKLLLETVRTEMAQERKSPDGKFWIYLSGPSTDQVARYTDNPKSKEPNDPIYLKYLLRKEQENKREERKRTSSWENIGFESSKKPTSLLKSPLLSLIKKSFISTTNPFPSTPATLNNNVVGCYKTQPPIFPAIKFESPYSIMDSASTQPAALYHHQSPSPMSISNISNNTQTSRGITSQIHSPQKLPQLNQMVSLTTPPPSGTFFHHNASQYSR